MASPIHDEEPVKPSFSIQAEEIGDSQDVQSNSEDDKDENDNGAPLDESTVYWAKPEINGTKMEKLNSKRITVNQTEGKECRDGEEIRRQLSAEVERMSANNEEGSEESFDPDLLAPPSSQPRPEDDDEETAGDSNEVEEQENEADLHSQTKTTKTTGRASSDKNVPVQTPRSETRILPPVRRFSSSTPKSLGTQVSSPSPGPDTFHTPSTQPAKQKFKAVEENLVAISEDSQAEEEEVSEVEMPGIDTTEVPLVEYVSDISETPDDLLPPAIKELVTDEMKILQKAQARIQSEQNKSSPIIDPTFMEVVATSYLPSDAAVAFERDEHGNFPAPFLGRALGKRSLEEQQEMIDLFVRCHSLITQSHVQPTTFQRREFERDVYDFARTLNMGRKAADVQVRRARAAVLRTRGLPGSHVLDDSDAESSLGIEADFPPVPLRLGNKRKRVDWESKAEPDESEIERKRQKNSRKKAARKAKLQETYDAEQAESATQGPAESVTQKVSESESNKQPAPISQSIPPPPNGADAHKKSRSEAKDKVGKAVAQLQKQAGTLKIEKRNSKSEKKQKKKREQLKKKLQDKSNGKLAEQTPVARRSKTLDVPKSTVSTSKEGKKSSKGSGAPAQKNGDQVSHPSPETSNAGASTTSTKKAFDEDNFIDLRAPKKKKRRSRKSEAKHTDALEPNTEAEAHQNFLKANEQSAESEKAPEITKKPGEAISDVKMELEFNQAKTIQDFKATGGEGLSTEDKAAMNNEIRLQEAQDATIQPKKKRVRKAKINKDDSEHSAAKESPIEAPVDTPTSPKTESQRKKEEREAEFMNPDGTAKPLAELMPINEDKQKKRRVRKQKEAVGESKGNHS